MPEMRAPLGWIKEFVDITMPVEALAERMTLAGMEVNEIEHLGGEWDRDKIVIGQLRAVRPHPNADSLIIAVVDHGMPEPQEVVTGAPNIRVGDSGQKVVFARRGARLIDGHAEGRQYMTLKPAKLRGVRSEGMVCSEKELDLSDEHTGIIILPDDAPVGMPLQDYLGDTVLNIEINPNIARCLSIVGVAREIAALTGQPLRLEQPEWLAEGAPIAGQVDIQIADPQLCSRYSGGLIRRVGIGPSPLWMKARLRAAGVRPINNVVDITNYVMLEWGQPLHAFDYDQLRGPSGQRPPQEAPMIIVRRAHKGERMTTLDGQDRALDEDMLLITDGGGPVALAGVMGGLESEVTAETTSILLEAANFDAINNRRTSQLLDLPSEAATRFGREIDPELTIPALKRAAELMRTLAGGEIAQGIADAYPVKPQLKVIDLPASEVKRLVGVELSAEQIIGYLEALGFGCAGPQAGVIRVTVPTYRMDVSLAADLVEEVARVYGSENIPLTLMSDPLPPQHNNPLLDGREKVRDALVECGLNEIICYSLLGAEDQGKLLAAYADPKPYQGILGADGDYPVPAVLAAKDCIELANPLSSDRRYMRTTLLPSMLATVRDNLRHQPRVALFEIGSAYLPRTGQQLPDEPWRLCIALSGTRQQAWWAQAPAEMMDYFDLKGIVEVVLDRLGIAEATYEPSDALIFQPGRAATLRIGDAIIGVMGEAHPLVREAFDLPEQRVAMLELDLAALLAHRELNRRFKPVSRYPYVNQDLALVMDEGVPAQRVEALIRQAGGEAIAAVRLFDVYRGDPIPQDKKSLAYSISFQDMDNTLTDKAVLRLRDKITQRLQAELGAQVRSL